MVDGDWHDNDNDIGLGDVFVECVRRMRMIESSSFRIEEKEFDFLQIQKVDLDP